MSKEDYTSVGYWIVPVACAQLICKCDWPVPTIIKWTKTILKYDKITKTVIVTHE